jgi:chemotaxis protein CheD
LNQLMIPSEPFNSLSVGLGEIKISKDPRDILVAYGLGSCLGIGMYDPQVQIGGLLHAVLPNHPVSNGKHKAQEDQVGKYVDSGVAALLDQLNRAGADQRRLIVRIAGGANMLTMASGAPAPFSPVLNIGSRNVEAALAVLAKHKLKIASQEVGGNIGRTVRFYVDGGRMTIRTVGNQEREI